MSPEAARAALSALAPRFTCAAVAVGDHPLHATERSLAAGFAPRRQHTFASGRAAARLVLGSDVPIPMLPNRAPAAPQGWRLSISHTDEVAIAAACRDTEAAGLGIDIEDVSRMDTKLRRQVVGPLDRVPDDADPLRLTATFSLRESLYKALMGEGAEGAYVRWSGEEAQIGVEGRALDLSYGWAQAEGHVVSWCAINLARPPEPEATRTRP